MVELLTMSAKQLVPCRDVSRHCLLRPLEIPLDFTDDRLVRAHIQAQVSIFAFYGRRSRPTGRVGVQYGSTPSAGVSMVGMGEGAIGDRA